MGFCLEFVGICSCEWLQAENWNMHRSTSWATVLPHVA